MIKHTISILGCLLLVTVLTAQNDLSSMMLRDSWQALQTNPALQPKGVLVNLPGVYNNLWLTNITFNDLVREEGGATILDIDQAINQLEASNLLRESIDIETVGVGFALGPIGVHIGHRMRFDALLDYPKTLAQLIWQGNAQFIGETIDFGPQVDLLSYHEFSLGLNIAITDNIRVGGRAKLLSGVGSIQTQRRDLQLTTNDDIYQLQLQADFLLNSSGSLNYDGLRNVDIDFNAGDFSASELFGGNTGLAFDLGVAADFDRLHVSASIVDIGGDITWEDDVNNYALTGEYEFEGLDLAQEILDDEQDFGGILDSLVETYNPIETSNSYTTNIGSKLYLQANYDLDANVTVGLLAFNENYRDLSTLGLAISGSMPVSSFARVGAFYGLRNERADNIGVNATIKIGPIRALLATDNIISAFRPKDASLANFRLGLNLLFGQER